jgi:hypothetical protein
LPYIKIDSGNIIIKIPLTAKEGDYPLKLSLTDINPNPKTQKYQVLLLIKPAVDIIEPVPAPS